MKVSTRGYINEEWRGTLLVRASSKLAMQWGWVRMTGCEIKGGVDG